MTRQEMESVLSSVLDVGEIMIMSGAEVNRVENTIQHMMCAYGCERVDAFAIISSILVTVKTAQGEALTQSRRISNYETDMYRLERCNSLSRKVCEEILSPEALREAVEEIRREKGCVGSVKMLAYGVISAAFSVFFGGTVKDGIAAFLCGLLLYFSVEVCARVRLQRIIQTIVCSVIVGLAAALLNRAGLGDAVDKVMIGNIMLLIPGMGLTTSMRDMISGDTVSGLMGLSEAVIRALAIALGFALVLWRFPV